MWLVIDQGGHVVPTEYEHPDGLPVDMNASVLRQVKSSIKQFLKFQQVLMNFYNEAAQNPDTVRRVR